MEEEQNLTTESTEQDLKEPISKEEIANKLAMRIVKGREILQKSEKLILKNLTIQGKNLKEWADELKVEVPEDHDDIRALEKASTKVAEAIQKAEYLLAAFELQSTAASNFFEEGFARKYVMEMENSTGNRIAAEKIRQTVLVDSLVDSSLAASQAGKVISEYFKRIVKGLEEVRKGLENRTRLLGMRFKYLNDL